MKKLTIEQVKALKQPFKAAFQDDISGIMIQEMIKQLWDSFYMRLKEYDLVEKKDESKN